MIRKNGENTSLLLDTLAYDRLSRQTGFARDAVNLGHDFRADFTYNRAGQLATIERYGDLSGASLIASSAYGYDATGRLTSLDHTRGSTVIADYDYTWDAAHRITSFASSQYTAENAVYSYDNAGQLTGADHNGGPADETYTYDDNGNRVLVNGTTSYVTSANNRLTNDGTFTYTYDNEGNRLTKIRISSASADDKTLEYSWDHRNRLTKVTFKRNDGTITKTVEQTYDMFNRWTKREIDPDGALGSASAVTDKFLWDGTQLLIDIRSDGATVSFAHGPGTDMVLFEDVDDGSGGGALYTLLGDHLNTVRDVLSTAGTVGSTAALG